MADIAALRQERETLKLQKDKSPSKAEQEAFQKRIEEIDAEIGSSG